MLCRLTTPCPRLSTRCRLHCSIVQTPRTLVVWRRVIVKSVQCTSQLQQTTLFEQLSVIMADPLRSVGIVEFRVAVDDHVPAALQFVRQAGFHEGEQTWWCTFCNKCVAKSTAYRHKDKHSPYPPEFPTVEAFYSALDNAYGALAAFTMDLSRTSGGPGTGPTVSTIHAT